MTELAIKPTRRETLRMVVAVVEKQKLAEARKARDHAQDLYARHQKALQGQNEAARAYGNAKYKALIRKLTRAIKPDFPGVKVSVYTDLEKERDSAGREQLKPGGIVTIRLYVSGVDKPGEQLPAGVVEKMAEAKAEADILWQEYLAANRTADTLSCKAQEYGNGYDDTKYAKLLQELVPALGPEAAVHLDALAALVEGAVKGRVKS